MSMDQLESLIENFFKNSGILRNSIINYAETNPVVINFLGAADDSPANSTTSIEDDASDYVSNVKEMSSNTGTINLANNLIKDQRFLHRIVQKLAAEIKNLPE